MKTDSPRCYPGFQDVLKGISTFFYNTTQLSNLLVCPESFMSIGQGKFELQHFAPSRSMWSVMLLCTIRPTSISFLRICQSPATGVVVVACLRGVFFVSSLIAACSSGPFSLRKQFFYASRGFVQMAGNSVVVVPRCDKLVRAVRLMAFVTTAIEERAQLVSSCWKRGLRMTVDICWERKLVTGAPGGKMTTRLLWTKTSTFQLTVNARLAKAFVEGSSVRTYEHRCEWNIASQLSGEIPSRSAVSERW